MRIDRFENGGSCELRLRGELRLSDARELFERALAEDCNRVVLDFSGCEVEDRALSALADLLNEAHVRLAVRGLRERQLRLLEYLGAARPLGG
jgi:STAS domain-containing protein